jgi:cytochrome c2
LVLVAFSLAIGCASGGSDPTPITPDAAEEPIWKTYDAERGELLFRSICGGYCHGVSEGKRDAPFLFDCEWQRGDSDEEIFAVIANGVTGTRMIGFGGKLPEGDADIWNVLAYLRKSSTCGATP